MKDPSSTGDPHGAFAYDGARGPLPPLSATAYVYDAMPEPVRLYSAPPVAYAPSLQTACAGSYGAHLPTVAGVRGTSKGRGAETGLDYFGARYFSGAQGRFTSPDEPFNDQNFSYPQSWNLYMCRQSSENYVF